MPRMLTSGAGASPSPGADAAAPGLAAGLAAAGDALPARFALSAVNRRIVAGMLTVAVATGVVKLAAVAKEMAIAARFGAGDQIDAFVIAYLLPSFVISVIATAFQAAVIPSYVEVRDQDGPDAARQLIANVTLWSGALLLGLTVVLALAAPLVLPLIGSRFGPAKLALTQHLLLGLLPLVLLGGLTAVWGAALNAESHFMVVAVTPVVTPVVVVLALYGARVIGIGALPAGMLAGAAIEAGVLAYQVRRRGLWVRPRWQPRHRVTGVVLRQFGTMAVGALLMSSTGVVDLAMAAMLGPGAVATLNYANRLVLFVLAFAAAAMSTVLLPHFSGLVARRDWPAVRHTLRTYLAWIALTTVPLTLVLMWLSVPLTRLLFERGAFDASTTRMVGGIQALYLVQVPFYLMGILLVRVISALKANHLLMWGSAISVVLNVGMNYLFMRWLGPRGIALSTSLVYVVSFGFLSVVLSRRLKAAIAGGG